MTQILVTLEDNSLTSKIIKAIEIKFFVITNKCHSL